MRATIEFKTVSKTVSAPIHCKVCGYEEVIRDDVHGFWKALRHSCKVVRICAKHEKECYGNKLSLLKKIKKIFVRTLDLWLG